MQLLTPFIINYGKIRPHKGYRKVSSSSFCTGEFYAPFQWRKAFICVYLILYALVNSKFLPYFFQFRLICWCQKNTAAVKRVKLLHKAHATL
ncbi:hypothetical protein CS542_09840 [Pedobacter sp. IW39]|nr:hypothetical protein CS542_09840 [Pedobacter sp. IW39]